MTTTSPCSTPLKKTKVHFVEEACGSSSTGSTIRVSTPFRVSPAAKRKHAEVSLDSNPFTLGDDNDTDNLSEFFTDRETFSMEETQSFWTECAAMAELELEKRELERGNTDNLEQLLQCIEQHQEEAIIDMDMEDFIVEDTAETAAAARIRSSQHYIPALSTYAHQAQSIGTKPLSQE